MNIFVVDRDPVVAARQLCDKHITKMTVESCQILATVMHRYGLGHLVTYKPTHQNSPCTRWAGDSFQNFYWLFLHAQELAYEFTRRYDKIHKSQQYLQEYSAPDALPDIGLTPFALVMPECYHDPCAVTAYRNFYIAEKNKFAKWKSGNEPFWWKSNNLQ